VGVALSLANAACALGLGMVVFGHGDSPVAGVSHDRWMLVHLDLALLGWLTLLIVVVARTLAPMLAQAPAAPPRRLPLDELLLAAGVWLLVAGIAASIQPLRLLGGSLVVLALAGFFATLVRSAARRRGPLEAPMVHLGAGAVFLCQAAVLGLGAAAGVFAPGRALVAYVLFLGAGWAGGVVLGHAGKLLSLSLWVWWPPGPRPKQAALYPRRLWLAEAAAFVAGTETVGIGILLGTTPLCQVGAAALCLSAILAGLGAVITWRGRPRL
jgi:hypothetical protein